MNESCHTYEGVMSHIWMSHVAHMNESCHTYEWVMSHIWTSHVTHMNESCHTYACVMSHIWTSHVTYMHESCLTYGRVMEHICCMQRQPISIRIAFFIQVLQVNTYEWVISNTCTSFCVCISESCCTYEYVFEVSRVARMNMLVNMSSNTHG